MSLGTNTRLTVGRWHFGEESSTVLLSDCIYNHVMGIIILIEFWPHSCLPDEMTLNVGILEIETMTTAFNEVHRSRQFEKSNESLVDFMIDALTTNSAEESSRLVLPIQSALGLY